MMNCPICAWPVGSETYLLIDETTCWRTVLAPNQALLGRCVVQLKRHAGDLADLTGDEMLELLTVIRQLEGALRAAFDATLFNWSCYMNHSYRENPPNPHIHWWAVPRYNHSVRIDDLVFEDPHFAGPYDHARWQDISAKIRAEIVRRIRAGFESG